MPKKTKYYGELKAIINNILNLSRFESGQIQIEDKNINILTTEDRL